MEVLGVRTRYVDVRATDEEGPPLLLVHGHASRIEEYDALVPLLAPRRRVIVVDLPGCGLADKPADREYTLARYQEFLLAFLDQLGAKTAHVAGGSLGGNLALRLGADHPERFTRLAVWAPAGAWRPMRGWMMFAKTMRRLPSFFWPSMWVQSRFWYSRSWPGRDAALEDAFRYYREVSGPGFFRMYWDVGHDQASTSLFDHVGRITQPVFLGWGDRDHALGMGVGVAALAKMIPTARLHVFPGASHSLANERVQELGQVVDAFLSEDRASDP
ncbi:MAG: alpha/beta hydrolase [Myxococcota bacterium]|nr:alpha/beta hydrolase [Myxococcota bacterium]